MTTLPDETIRRRGEEMVAEYTAQMTLRSQLQTGLQTKDARVFDLIEEKDASMAAFKTKYDVWIQAQDALGDYFKDYMSRLAHLATQSFSDDAFKFIADGANVTRIVGGETMWTWWIKNVAPTVQQMEYVRRVLALHATDTTVPNSEGETGTTLQGDKNWWALVQND